MDKNIDIHIEEALKAYLALGVKNPVYYPKFTLYYIMTESDINLNENREQNF